MVPPLSAGTLYQNNTVNLQGTVSQSFPLFLAATDPLFVDAANGNFYLAEGSKAIDSSVDSLQDRPAMVTVKTPIGLPPSPIPGPVAGHARTVAFGRSERRRLRPAWAATSSRIAGAIDRIDFLGPTANLLQGVTQLPDDANLVGQRVAEFAIKLTDTLGTGIDDSSVTVDMVTVYRSDRPTVALTAGDTITSTRYDTTNHIIHLAAGPGVWADGFAYTIVLNNTSTGIRDIASNLLLPNRADGTTTFTIDIRGVDFGDAPMYEVGGRGSHQLQCDDAPGWRPTSHRRLCLPRQRAAHRRGGRAGQRYRHGRLGRRWRRVYERPLVGQHDRVSY